MNPDIIWPVIWGIIIILYFIGRHSVKKSLKENAEREAMSREVENKVAKEEK